MKENRYVFRTLTSTTAKMRQQSLLIHAIFVVIHLALLSCDVSTANCPFKRPHVDDNGSKQLLVDGSSVTLPDRILHVAVCDTRSGWKEFQALKIWNVTGAALRDQGVHMSNVCKGMSWGKQGFLTKPLIYLNHIQMLLETHGPDSKTHLHHIILMDSDTFWSTDNVRKVWTAYDCARGNKSIVVSTEMSCWVGRYCQQADLDRWYSDPRIVPSYSPFVNSGVVMGGLESVAAMLDYIIRHNQSYVTTYGKRKGFDDQYAIADYAINILPEAVQLDYHQQISASASIHAPGNPPDEGWPFVCKNRNGSFSMSCHVYTSLVKKLGHFHLDSSNCLVGRKVHGGMVLSAEMSSLAAEPLIWHGNGAGKQTYLHFGYHSFKCFLRRRNSTEQSHDNTYG